MKDMRGIVGSLAILLTVALGGCEDATRSMSSVRLLGLPAGYTGIVLSKLNYPKEIQDMSFQLVPYCVPEEVLAKLFGADGAPDCSGLVQSKLDKTQCYPATSSVDMANQLDQDNDLIDVRMAVYGQSAETVSAVLNSITSDDVLNAGKYANGMGYSLTIPKTITAAQCGAVAVLHVTSHYFKQAQ